MGDNPDFFNQLFNGPCISTDVPQFIIVICYMGPGRYCWYVSVDIPGKVVPELREGSAATFEAATNAAMNRAIDVRDGKA